MPGIWENSAMVEVNGTESVLLAVASVAVLLAAIVTGLIAWRNNRNR